MMKRSVRVLVTLAALAAAAPAAEIVMKTDAWPDRRDFGKLAKLLFGQHGRNLLARKGVKLSIEDGRISGQEYLADGDAGAFAGHGRVNVQGRPAVLTYYLGAAKPIHRIGVFTCNGDQRANQDWEVRLADNSKHPGKKPEFGDKPLATTGPKVLGNDGGGFYTYFERADGKPMGKADWVQFRIWQTYRVSAGHPARSTDPTSWTAVIELEVFGDPKDVKKTPPEVLARRKARRKALSDAPGKPEFDKKPTWQETVVAAREAILEWECTVDALAAPAAGVEVGPWHTLGALDADDPAIRQLERTRKLDLAEPLVIEGKGKDKGEKRTLTWTPRKDIADGELLDVAGKLNARPGQAVVLCRSLRMDRPFGRRREFAFGVGLADGRMKVLGGRSSMRAPRDTGPVRPNQVTWQLREGPGRYHVLAVLPADEKGRCRMWFMPQVPTQRPGAGNQGARAGRRRSIFNRVEDHFPDPVSRMQMGWEREDSIWNREIKGQMARRTYLMCDWQPGEQPLFLIGQYNRYADRRLADARREAERMEPAIRRRVGPWLDAFENRPPGETVADARARYYAIASVQRAMAEHHGILSMRLAVEDQQATFDADEYPKAGEFLARIDALDKAMAKLWPRVLDAKDGAMEELADLARKADDEGGEILLANPLLAKMPGLLLGRGGPGFSSNWGGANNLGGEIVKLSPVRPEGEFSTVYKGGRVSDMDLSFDAKKLLFCDGRHIHEIGVDGAGYRQITKQTDEHVKHYDACRLPSGKIVFVSTACEQAVPCTGGWHVGNLHVIDADGTNQRRLTYDQDHDWNPAVLPNGQVIYTRWEYTDTPHYFTRLLFTMNPDGTAQMEYYGSNSYWPNAMYWPRSIPGFPTRVVCIVSGHHGVSRTGQMVILDTARGRHEADGVIQRIGERGRRVEPVIIDGLVKDWWPRFAYPWPLAEPKTHRGAGKYFLANCRMNDRSGWCVALVDVYDNITPLVEGHYACPIPLWPRRKPPAIPPRVDLSRDDALVYMTDVYMGGGLAGFPKGTVKALRIGAHVYRYGGNGDTRAATFEGGWDVKRILGTVPVEPDGSAYFRVPCNTPVFVQPLDEQGRALQTMRSWFTAMPGEVLSCVGCHERQSTTPPTLAGAAAARKPSEIAPWFGPVRGFSFDREVQPVLDRKCVGCHDGSQGSRPDFRAKRLHKNPSDRYSPAYMALAPYVRRAGYEADYHLPKPAEWNAETSPLVQMLLKGHHNVRLSGEQWRRLYAWIDFNVPYAANWRDSHRPPDDDQVARRTKYMKLYAGIDYRDEKPHPLPQIGKYQPPEPAPEAPAPLALDGWPLDDDGAARRRAAAGLEPLALDLGDGVTMRVVPVPGGRFVMGDANGTPDEHAECVVDVPGPFLLGAAEVTNRQYAQFDPDHDSAYMDARGKDRFTRGYPVNEPNQPVIRVSWYQAMAFCRWLTRRTGREVRLPTEAEWEYACRAGTATPWSFGAGTDGLSDVANVADRTLSRWAWGRVEGSYSDGARFSVASGRYPPNRWGLSDMHGNVAEWTLSDYCAYPYDAGDGRNAPPTADNARTVRKVVRGGSWNDKFDQCRSGARWRYAPHQPVYNVGFRVLVSPRKLVKR